LIYYSLLILTLLWYFDQRMSTLTPGNTIYTETLWELLPILNTKLSGTLSQLPSSRYLAYCSHDWRGRAT